MNTLREESFVRKCSKYFFKFLQELIFAKKHANILRESNLENFAITTFYLLLSA